MHQTYHNYQTSNTEWLGDIPAHWEIRRMKYLFEEISIKNKPNEELLSVTQNQGVVPRSWVENRMVMPSGNLESFKLIHKGDFSISLRSFEGGIEYCYYTGIISPAYTVLKKKILLTDGYYKFLFKSQSFISEIQKNTVGIRDGKNVNYTTLSYSLLPIPPLIEQQAIANFLDEQTAKIDHAISQQEQMIGLLKSYKQSLIQTVVTQGLKPNTALRPSGIEWLGDIPAHWEVRKLKYLGIVYAGMNGKKANRKNWLAWP